MTNQVIANLINDYSPENLSRFIQSKNRDFRPAQDNLDDFVDEKFLDGLKLGEIIFGPAQEFLICSFKVIQSLSERSGKKAQYEKAKDVLRFYQADAGIFVFYDTDGNFRFSLVYAIYRNTRVDWSNFRRFTYFVSPELTNKTFIQRMNYGDFSSLENIKSTFSVEVVTQRFFNEFRSIFDKTKEEFEEINQHTVCDWLRSKYGDDEYNEQINKFIFTFLGRIIFLYFLLRKGWIENKKDYIRKIVEDDQNTNLYQNLFKPLFFDVFAKEKDDRPVELRDRFNDTPYLNGGLFEHSELERQMAAEGRYILFNDDFIRDIILNFFEVYNFTVDENSPDDQEVSIDPEMLGKVFENTLAEEERGQRGTFYTPREIVHFMVKDALRQFLHNETGISLDKLQKLIYSDDEELEDFTANQIRLIDSKLEAIKVLDPAVGSGAFPVEMMQVLIDLRKRLNVRVGRRINEVALKKELIKNNLYGVDIDPGAIEIAKLRLWLALIVDYDKSLAEPLPNLDFQFRVGNSLQEKIGGIDIFRESGVTQLDLLNANSDIERIKNEMIRIKDLFYQTDNEDIRHNLKERFDEREHQLIHAVLERYREQLTEQIRNRNYRNTNRNIQETLRIIDHLEQKINDGTYKLFKPDFHFSEVFDREDDEGNRVGGFDIVIGNPPYGVKIDRDIRDWHVLGSRDSYGVFISTSLKRFLKPKGILEFIVSDTWLTIKTHKALRQQVLQKQLHKVIQLHQDCFDATVNACIINVSNFEQPNNVDIIAADLTNVSTRNDIEQLRRLIYDLGKIKGESTPIYGVYAYPQALINSNSTLPIFVGSPKLFKFMQDVDVEIETREIGEESASVRQIEFNGEIVELVRFGDIAEVKVGLQTGDNKAYLFQNPEARGRYRDINEYESFLLTEDDLDEIVNDEEKRMKVIEFGIHKSRDEENFDEDRWFDGRYIVPYDKGGASDTEAGWLPNYYVPTDYFIDWSTWAVNRMKTLTIADRIRINGENKAIKPHYETQIAAVFRNIESYFLPGITFSDTGFYAPTFRITSSSVYDVMGMSIFTSINRYQVIGILCGKLIKYIIKNFINHTVHTQVEGVTPIPIRPTNNREIIDYVKEIINKQKSDKFYDYMSNEQKIIDKLVYEFYNLNHEDIHEIETWYARRYPKLAHLSNI